MHHFFVSQEQIDLENKKIFIQGRDVNHIKNVLRIKTGDEILISDGTGNDYVVSVEKYCIIITKYYKKENYFKNILT